MDIFIISMLLIMIAIIIFIVIKKGTFHASKRKLENDNKFVSDNKERISELFDKNYGELNPLKKRVWYSVIVFVIGIISVFFVKNQYYMYIAVGIPVLFVIYNICEYNNKIDRKFIEIAKEVIHDFDSDLEYKPNGGFTSSEYASCHFPEDCDRFYSEDMIVNLKKGFSFADITVESEHRDKDDDIHYVTEYEGSLAKMYIQNVGCRIFLGGMRENLFFKSNNYIRIKFENDEFNDLFMAYSDNELQAYKILTPDVMEEFVKIKKSTYGDISIRLLDNKLYIRFLSGNGFDNSSFNKNADKKNLCQSIAVLEEVMKTMEKVKNIIESKNMD